MKKTISIIAAAMLMGCQDGDFGQGGKNAAQYVREQVPEQADNIASIETIAEDSLLGFTSFGFAEMEMAKKGSEFLNGTISKDEYSAIIDSISNVAQDISDSWQFSAVVNDSLHKLEKYNGLWRKAYTVRVTLKNGDTKEPRVLMDEDGITPSIIEREMQRRIEEHTQHILEAQRNLSEY